MGLCSPHAHVLTRVRVRECEFDAIASKDDTRKVVMYQLGTVWIVTAVIAFVS